MHLCIHWFLIEDDGASMDYQRGAVTRVRLAIDAALQPDRMCAAARVTRARSAQAAARFPPVTGSGSALLSRFSLRLQVAA
ncbi:MAG: hypothetical protein JW966_16015 [Anaerolineae bacterium]|nr:hypothetical protein [Anaerolineae bacterium]